MNVATKEETITAGIEMMESVNPTQRENHQKVIAWIRTLKNVPSTTNAKTTYKECMNEWYHVHVKGQPNGTGSYNLETV